ncbi:precorrin-6y C5,15-methyltransferase (decarboxylating) subunit CbiE [Actinoplanes sp. NPDC051470]|uniref:precorrin-6y C5,15-methyltransferase (decarboxylating) subunit CbiE n=1 Tax=Actinoplanes sp. NPDC051470 TaxID=3157224 RepID=UPI003429239D
MLKVVGIGAGGWSDLSGTATAALRSASVVLGSRRQLDLLPSEVTAERMPWPSPLLPALPGLLESFAERDVAVLASGDPMFHGIGATLARLLNPSVVAQSGVRVSDAALGYHLEWEVIPHPSSVSLAAARLGWALAEVEVVSLVNAPVSNLRRRLNPGRRILILSAGAGTPAEVVDLVHGAGFSESDISVLSDLGGPAESVTAWAGVAAEEISALNIVAVECRGGPATPVVPGLPDNSYESDGQLTKREVRAVTLATLGPAPGELLWDVGAGAGSIAIEWMRAHPSCRAIAVEADPARAATIETNAARLGVPGLTIVTGTAPAALTDLPSPDVVFIGGGITTDGLVEACLAALPGGGRLVANAVTLESEAVLTAWHGKLGGELTRVAVQRSKPVGGFTGWHTMMPVTILSVVKP